MISETLHVLLLNNHLVIFSKNENKMGTCVSRKKLQPASERPMDLDSVQ